MSQAIIHSTVNKMLLSLFYWRNQSRSNWLIWPLGERRQKPKGCYTCRPVPHRGWDFEWTLEH